MLARPYLPKVCVVTYLDDVCLPELDFLYVRHSQIYEISLEGPNSVIIRVSIKLDKKRTNGGRTEQKMILTRAHAPSCAPTGSSCTFFACFTRAYYATRVTHK